jgi:CopG family nickel-responsive transcriptional regulator
MKVTRFSVSIEEEALGKLDNYAAKNKLPNRSQAIRFLISNTLVEEKWEKNKTVAGAIILVYDHHKRDLLNKSTSVQHDYHEVILAAQHIHLSHDNCLETIAVKGKSQRIKELADKLIGLKGIKHGKLVMSAAE